MNNSSTNRNRTGLPYSVAMEARDHECDIQGVVNNAHYQHYFEHARHRFLLDNNIDFAGLTQQGINLMVSKVGIEYFASIRAHDHFYVTVDVQQASKIRYQFIQKIFNNDDHRLLAQAKTTVVTVGNNKKPLHHTPLKNLVA